MDASGRARDLAEDDDDDDDDSEVDTFKTGDIWYQARLRKPLDMSEVELGVFMDLILSMLAWDLDARPSAAEVLEHEWFKRIF